MATTNLRRYGHISNGFMWSLRSFYQFWGINKKLIMTVREREKGEMSSLTEELDLVSCHLVTSHEYTDTNAW